MHSFALGKDQEEQGGKKLASSRYFGIEFVSFLQSVVLLNTEKTVTAAVLKQVSMKLKSSDFTRMWTLKSVEKEKQTFAIYFQSDHYTKHM